VRSGRSGTVGQGAVNGRGGRRTKLRALPLSISGNSLKHETKEQITVAPAEERRKGGGQGTERKAITRNTAIGRKNPRVITKCRTISPSTTEAEKKANRFGKSLFRAGEIARGEEYASAQIQRRRAGTKKCRPRHRTHRDALQEQERGKSRSPNNRVMDSRERAADLRKPIKQARRQPSDKRAKQGEARVQRAEKGRGGVSLAPSNASLRGG